MYDALSFMPELRVSESEEDRISTGGTIAVDSGRSNAAADEFVRITPDGTRLIAVGRCSKGPEGLLVRPVRVFIDPP